MTGHKLSPMARRNYGIQTGFQMGIQMDIQTKTLGEVVSGKGPYGATLVLLKWLLEG
jgi:hypothetical protein